MALLYYAYGNTPCTIYRYTQSTASVADGDDRTFRVSGYGVPTPPGFFGAAYDGDFDNPLFFKRLLAATMQLIGATAPEQVSAATVPLLLYNVLRDVNPTIEASWRTGPPAFPNAVFPTAPLFENVFQTTGGGGTAVKILDPNFIVFEDTLGVSAPRWADITFDLRYPSVDVPAGDDFVLQIKIFHSLTF
jgi:hypothetical protein